MKAKIIAHRGARTCPENTLSAFSQAIVQGVDCIEFDVYLSSDGCLVVHHDYFLGRTNNGVGRIHECSLEYLRSLDAGSWFSPEFQDEKVPTFEEVLELAKNRVQLEIELKGIGKQFLEKVVHSLDSFNVCDQVEITSPSFYLLSYLREIRPDVKTGMFVPSPPEWMDNILAILAEELTIQSLQYGHINVAHLPRDFWNPLFVARLQEQGFVVHFANCNSSTDFLAADECRADQFSTDMLVSALGWGKERNGSK